MKNQRVGKLVGEYRHQDRCRFCLSEGMFPFIDFGLVPLAGGFLKAGSTETDFRNERVYPLQIFFCPNCSLVQVNNAISGDVLFKDYFYRSSAIGTLVKHFQQYAAELREKFQKPDETLIVELGCNDGILLKPLKKQGFNVVGVDPATNVVTPLRAEGLSVLDAYFTEDSAGQVREKYGAADAILSSNSFAHIDDMHDVMRGVKALLKPDGFLAFEVHYLAVLLKEMHYDMMYHEHLSYYSLTAIENFAALFDMEVFDVVRIPVHGGSVRFCLQNKGTGLRPVGESVRKMRSEELDLRLSDPQTYRDFGKKVSKAREDLVSLLEDLKKRGKRIVGYGASGRATAMSAYCGLGSRFLDGVIDDAPAKQGAFTPGNHQPIVGSSLLASPDRPDYALLFAWAFADEIKNRNTEFLASGGKFIVPLPEVRLIET